jgi:hypothetical protein
MLSVLVVTDFNIKFGVDSDFDEDISLWQDPRRARACRSCKSCERSVYGSLCVSNEGSRRACTVEGWQDECVTLYV